MDYTSLIKEVDIPELVKALRCKALSKQCDSCGYGYHLSPDSECNDACDVEQIYADAAAAIEALEAEVKSKHGELDALRVFTDEAQNRIEELQAEVERLEPKRGEWVRVEDKESYHYECSECGERPLYSRYGDVVLSGVCPMCGAQMEVQDEQK